MPELWVLPGPRLIGAATVLQPDPPDQSTAWLTRGRRPDKCPRPWAGAVRAGRVRARSEVGEYHRARVCAEVGRPRCRGSFPDIRGPLQSVCPRPFLYRMRSPGIDSDGLDQATRCGQRHAHRSVQFSSIGQTPAKLLLIGLVDGADLTTSPGALARSRRSDRRFPLSVLVHVGDVASH